MVVPTKGITPQRSLLAVGAQILLTLDRPLTVSQAWPTLQEWRRIRGHHAPVPFWWFVLASTRCMRWGWLSCRRSCWWRGGCCDNSAPLTPASRRSTSTRVEHSRCGHDEYLVGHRQPQQCRQVQRDRTAALSPRRQRRRGIATRPPGTAQHDFPAALDWPRLSDGILVKRTPRRSPALAGCRLPNESAWPPCRA
jgi:hypothetical protein